MSNSNANPDSGSSLNFTPVATAIISVIGSIILAVITAWTTIFVKEKEIRDSGEQIERSIKAINAATLKLNNAAASASKLKWTMVYERVLGAKKTMSTRKLIENIEQGCPIRISISGRKTDADSGAGTYYASPQVMYVHLSNVYAHWFQPHFNEGTARSSFTENRLRVYVSTQNHEIRTSLHYYNAADGGPDGVTPYEGDSRWYSACATSS